MNEYFLKALKTLENWISIKSVKSTAEKGAPFGLGVAEMAKKAVLDATELGLKVNDYDGYVIDVSFGDGDDENAVAVLCHLDVVPEGSLSLWETNPYILTEKDGYLCGRGVVDDKGAAVLCLYALKELKDSGFTPKRKVKLIFGLDEESGWGCIDHYNKVAVMPKTGFSPDGDFPVLYAEKGIYHIEYSFPAHNKLSFIEGGERVNMVCDKCSLVLDGEKYEFLGTSAHGSTPEKGDNAIRKALEFLTKKGAFSEEVYEKLFNGRLFEKTFDESGKMTFSPNVIYLENGLIKLKVDVRYPVHYTVSEIEKLLRKVGNFTLLSAQKPLYQNKDGDLVKKLRNIYEKHTGDKTAPITTGGGTYARALKNGVAFGPSILGEHCCHVPNEKISVERLEKCYEIYKEAIYELAK